MDENYVPLRYAAAILGINFKNGFIQSQIRKGVIKSSNYKTGVILKDKLEVNVLGLLTKIHSSEEMRNSYLRAYMKDRGVKSPYQMSKIFDIDESRLRRDARNGDLDTPLDFWNRCVPPTFEKEEIPEYYLSERIVFDSEKSIRYFERFKVKDKEKFDELYSAKNGFFVSQNVGFFQNGAYQMNATNLFTTVRNFSDFSLRSINVYYSKYYPIVLIRINGHQYFTFAISEAYKDEPDEYGKLDFEIMGVTHQMSIDDCNDFLSFLYRMGAQFFDLLTYTGDFSYVPYITDAVNGGPVELAPNSFEFNELEYYVVVNILRNLVRLNAPNKKIWTKPVDEED
ncbi:hypothetical protein ACWY2R_07175 [Enterococcus avium]